MTITFPITGEMRMVTGEIVRITSRGVGVKFNSGDWPTTAWSLRWIKESANAAKRFAGFLSVNVVGSKSGLVY